MIMLWCGQCFFISSTYFQALNAHDSKVRNSEPAKVKLPSVSVAMPAWHFPPQIRIMSRITLLLIYCLTYLTIRANFSGKSRDEWWWALIIYFWYNIHSGIDIKWHFRTAYTSVQFTIHWMGLHCFNIIELRVKPWEIHCHGDYAQYTEYWEHWWTCCLDFVLTCSFLAFYIF